MQMNNLQQNNRLQNIDNPNQLNKMASRLKISPLLQPYHAYHGVGRNRGEINIFLEFSKMCGLNSVTSTTNTYSLNSNQAEASAADTPLTNNLDLTQTHGDQDGTGQTSTATCELKDHGYKVYELGQNGNTSEEIQYSLNNKTLQLFQVLKGLNISFRIEVYKPKEQRLQVNSNIFYCKNLFLKDRKGQFYLVICHEDRNINLKQLRKDLKAYRNFNFCNAEDMFQILDVEPGGVTPLALLRKESAQVSMVICKSLQKDGSTLMFHPLDSNLAVEITMPDLQRFFKHLKHQVTFLQDY